MPYHDKAHKESQACCDKLFASLRSFFPDLEKFKSKETCAFYVPGKNRFAHVYHRGKDAKIRVYFRGDATQTITDSSGIISIQRRDKVEKGWDKEFPFFAEISTDESIPAFAKLLFEAAEPLSEKKKRRSAKSKSPDSTVVTDIKTIILDKTIDSTTMQTLVNARVGQGKFGMEVRALWNHRCCITGAITKVTLEASHIRPWSDSDNAQRLDPHNGLLLTANLHKLFDAGLISFDESGALIVSPSLSQLEQKIFDLIGKRLFKKPSIETANYLAYHRAQIFKK